MVGETDQEAGTVQKVRPDAPSWAFYNMWSGSYMVTLLKPRSNSTQQNIGFSRGFPQVFHSLNGFSPEVPWGDRKWSLCPKAPMAGTSCVGTWVVLSRRSGTGSPKMAALLDARFFFHEWSQNGSHGLVPKCGKCRHSEDSFCTS